MEMQSTKFEPRYLTNSWRAGQCKCQNKRHLLVGGSGGCIVEIKQIRQLNLAIRIPLQYQRIEDDSFELYGQEQLNSADIQYLNSIQVPAQSDQSSQLQPNCHIQREAKIQMEKEITEQFQFNQQNTACKICYKHAIDGVVCRNQKCSKLFCSPCITKKIMRCPFCGASPFKYMPSPFRSAINKFQLTCQFCQGRYQLQQEQAHYQKKCQYFRKEQCDYCEERVLPEQLAMHYQLIHKDKLGQIIKQLCSTPRASFDPKELLQKNQQYLRKIDRTPHLGPTGKFYCKKRLEEPICTCCNGYCGPIKGENCVQCMKMDIKRLGLKKGFLVNSDGHVCWREGEDFVCGVMTYYQHSFCRVGAACRPCKNMKTNINRYSDLL